MFCLHLVDENEQKIGICAHIRVVSSTSENRFDYPSKIKTAAAMDEKIMPKAVAVLLNYCVPVSSIQVVTLAYTTKNAITSPIMM